MTVTPIRQCSRCAHVMRRPGFKDPVTYAEICFGCWRRFSEAEQLVLPFSYGGMPSW